METTCSFYFEPQNHLPNSTKFRPYIQFLKQVLTNFVLFRFDQIFEPGSASDPMSDKAELMNRKVPLEMLIKAQDEPKISKEEENTVVLQVRGCS